MKSIIFSGLSVLLLSSLAPAVNAQMNDMNSNGMNSNVNSSQMEDVKPVDLVYLGYQGYFKDQGIPSTNDFTRGARSGDITAEQLINSAIETGKLSPEAANDSEFVGRVDYELKNFKFN